MDNGRFYRYYHSTGFGWKSLAYYYLLAERYFKASFNFGPQCGGLTAITCFLAILVFTYTITSFTIFRMNLKKLSNLLLESDQKLPRKESVLQVRPAYNCINKHLQQTDIFLDKLQKVIRKEELEVELLNDKINSISELLNPGSQSEWGRSKSPIGYFRDINTPLKL